MASVLEIESVSKKLGHVQVLRDVSLRIDAGAVVGLVGPNGAGKTTTLNVATGLLFPDKGRVRISGYDIQSERIEALTRLGYVSDSPFLYDHLSAKEFLLLVGRIRRLHDVEARAKRLLDEFRLPQDNRTLGEYSMGMRKKVALCAALLPTPSVLIMDEPFNAVDYAGTIALLEEMHRLHSSGISILVATHLMELVQESCTHIAFMHNSQIDAVRTVPQILEQFPRLEEAFIAYCKEE